MASIYALSYRITFQKRCPLIEDHLTSEGRRGGLFGM